ncbi:cupin domain-containing protein [Desulfitobacterium metallireducens]|uniref:Cupin n=1 Tax=Desulfitobacterium metallireducens DSM 15288 TaxID=871968 RepID=W0E921_9FIRM|nr:cupin domain-containing protein [Desulfitobacterium metallireducens]AHF06033.1 cupin [Desulfitobacterium metallireducens DSM 15288]
MKFFRFSKDTGQSVERYESRSVIYSRIAQTFTPARIGFMYVEPEGIIGIHEAPTPQLFLVVQGEGWIRRQSNAKVVITTGEGVFFDKGELHESGSVLGMTCIIVQSDEFNSQIIVL